MMNPETLALALEQLEAELPHLLGSEPWAALRPQYTQYRDQLQAENGHIVRLQAAANLIDLLVPYEAVQTRLRLAIHGLDIYQMTLTQLASIARQLSAESRIITELEEAAAFHSHRAQTRTIILEGVGKKAQSVKWQNFAFDFGEFAEMAAGILSACSTIIDPDRNYLLMAAGVLLIIRGVRKALTVEISEQEASVFWGVIQAQRHHVPGRVDTAQVVEHTNLERAKVHLASLSETEVRRKLHNLEQLGSVAKVDGSQEKIWRVVESYKSEE